MSEDIMEFGFDDAGHIKPVGVEKWKQAKAGQIDRVCIVSFNRYHDVVLRAKTREKGSDLTNDETTDILSRVDAKIAEKLGKKVEDLTDVDRLDFKSPKFWNSYTHFDEKEEKGGSGAGTFRCLSTWKGSQQIKQEICCKRFGEPEQKIATAIMTYPIDDNKQVDIDLLLKKRYTNFYVWVLNVKKFKKIESCYAEAKSEDRHVIDLKVELDGDPQYQKQNITGASHNSWVNKDYNIESRTWILEGGLRAGKSMNNHLGYKLTKEKLLEKIEGKKNSGAHRMETSEPKPQMAQGYDDLIS